MDGVRSEQQLASAVGQPEQSAFGEDAYRTIPEKAAAYGFFIAEGQPFLDGNKRTALLAFETFLHANGTSSPSPKTQSFRCSKIWAPSGSISLSSLVGPAITAGHVAGNRGVFRNTFEQATSPRRSSRRFFKRKGVPMRTIMLSVCMLTAGCGGQALDSPTSPTSATSSSARTEAACGTRWRERKFSRRRRSRNRL